MRTIDITPTWAGITPVLIEAAARGTTAKGRKAATEELHRMARIADTAVAGKKAADECWDAIVNPWEVSR